MMIFSVADGILQLRGNKEAMHCGVDRCEDEPLAVCS